MSTQPIERRVIPTWTLGDHLRKARSVARMDQREFAAQLGVPPGSLAAWETDRARPRDLVAIARRIELLTGIPASWTLGLDDNGPRPGSDQDEGRGSVRHQGLEPRTRWLMPGVRSEGLDGAQVFPFRCPGAEPEIAA